MFRGNVLTKLTKFMAIGLKEKLYFISIGMVLFISFAVFVPFQKGIEDQKASKRVGFALYYNNLTNSISEQFFTNYNNVQSFARNKDLKDKDPGASTFLLNELVTLYPDTDMLFLIGLDGKLIAHSEITATGEKLNTEFLKSYNFKNDNWFQKTSKGEYTENYDKKIFGAFAGKVHESEMISKVYGEKRMGQYFSTRIEDEYGDPIAVLGAFVGSRWFESEMKNLFHTLNSNGMDSSEIHLINSEGKVITSYDKELAKKDKNLHDFENYNLAKTLIASDDEMAVKMKEGKVDTILHPHILGDSKETYLYSFGEIHHRRFLDMMKWKLVIGMTEKQAYGEIITLQNLFYFTLAGVLILCVAISFATVRNLYKQLLGVVASLENSAKSTVKFVENLNGVSHRVSELTSNQAQAIHETASTLDELSSMVKMNAQNAATSVDVSTDNERVAQDGKHKVEEVKSSMNNIKQANDDVLRTTNDGSEKISEIVNLINEINEKTQVINDIVFQTKLLSFNASVEAARAGEHGKGFAVVAEEVGNLAAMSGTASEEINAILTKSVAHVEKIVKENKESVESMIEQSRVKIDDGIKVSEECTGALEEIVHGVMNVSSMSQEISAATSEQETGVTNISQAMNQMQEASSDNQEIASKMLQYAEDLNNETNNLQNVLSILQNEIIGGRTKNDASTSKVKKTEDAKVVKFPKESNHKKAS